MLSKTALSSLYCPLGIWVYYLTAICHLKATSPAFVNRICLNCNTFSMSGAEKLIHAFMASRLDYCCTLLGGFPACLIYKLQLVQNPAARALTRTRKDDHISPVQLTNFCVIYVSKFWPVDDKTFNIKIDCRRCIFFLLNTQIQSVSR